VELKSQSRFFMACNRYWS